VSWFGASAEAGGVVSGFSRRHIDEVLPNVAAASQMIDSGGEGVCASNSGVEVCKACTGGVLTLPLM
jgi:hypothetical protein